MTAKKDSTKRESKFEEAPKIVEVYGEKSIKPKLKIKEIKSEKEDMNEEDNLKQSEERPEMVVEKVDKEDDKKVSGKDQKESETLKTEVVGGEQGTAVDSLERKQASADAKAMADKQDDSALRQAQDDSALRQAQDDSAFEEEIGHQRKAVRGVFGVGLIVFLVIFGLTGWAFYLKTVWLPKETVTEVLVADATPEPTTTPEPTPNPLTREEISLEVLNGSGEVGLAGKVAGVFEELGYNTPEVGNGNSVDKTQLYVQKESESRLSVLLSDVEDELGVASISGYLKETDEVTARIVLGK